MVKFRTGGSKDETEARRTLSAEKAVEKAANAKAKAKHRAKGWPGSYKHSGKRSKHQTSGSDSCDAASPVKRKITSASGASQKNTPKKKKSSKGYSSQHSKYYKAKNNRSPYKFELKKSRHPRHGLPSMKVHSDYVPETDPDSESQSILE